MRALGGTSASNMSSAPPVSCLLCKKVRRSAPTWMISGIVVPFSESPAALYHNRHRTERSVGGITRRWRFGLRSVHDHRLSEARHRRVHAALPMPIGLGAVAIDR